MAVLLRGKQRDISGLLSRFIAVKETEKGWSWMFCMKPEFVTHGLRRFEPRGEHSSEESARSAGIKYLMRTRPDLVEEAFSILDSHPPLS